VVARLDPVGRFPQASRREGWEPAFWMIFRLSGNPLGLLDEERIFVDVNDALTDLLGRSRLELIGMSMEEVISPSERERAAREWEGLLLHGGEYAGKRYLLRADASKLRVDFAARLIVLDGRQLAVYVVLKREPSSSTARSSAGLTLTTRERDVITLIALGRDTGEIAGELHISPETVRSHVRNAMAKLGAHTRAQLVAEVLSNDQALHTFLLEEQNGN
jgi:PAS domain S-box-containing protein